MKLEELTELKQKIERGKTRLSELKGQKDAQLKLLQKEFKCSSIAEAQEKLEQMEKEIDKKKSQINNKIETLETEHPELFE